MHRDATETYIPELEANNESEASYEITEICLCKHLEHLCMP